MGLKDVWHIARRRWLLIVGAIAVCVGVAGAYAASQPTSYTASSSVYVSMATGTSVNDSYQGVEAAQARVASYVNLASTYTVAERAIRDAGVSMSPAELQQKITATYPPATTLIDISVTDSDPARAKLLDDKVVAQFRRLVDQLETTVPGAAPAAKATVVDAARLPTSPTGPNVKRWVGLGLAVGLVLGCLGAFVRDRFDRRLYTSSDLETILPVPLLGIIDIGRPGAAGEQRRLRARLTNSIGNTDAAAVMVTSLSARSEPEVAVDLAKSLSSMGSQVALVDADTSGCGSSTIVPVTSDIGLAELLTSRSDPVDALARWDDAGLHFLSLGPADGRTADLLASERLTDIVSALKDKFDWVIIDAAPVTGAADALTLSRRCDGTLGVVELDRSTAPQVSGALSTFRQGGTGMLGAVAISRATKLFDRIRGVFPR